MKGHEAGDSIHGHRIIAEARKISDPVVIAKSARHKAQSIMLTENALAIIDRKGRRVRSGMISPQLIGHRSLYHLSLKADMAYH